MNSTFAHQDLEVLRNRIFDEIVVGDRATIQRTLTAGRPAALRRDVGRRQSAHMTPSRRSSAMRRHRARHVGRGAHFRRARHAAAGTRHELRRPDAEIPCAGSRRRHADHHGHREVSRGGDAARRARLPVHEPGRRDGDLRRGDGIAPTERIERPRGTLPQVRISLAARRRARARAAVREAARPHQDGRRPSLRRDEPVGRARRPRRRDDRAGPDRTARAARRPWREQCGVDIGRACRSSTCRTRGGRRARRRARAQGRGRRR